MKHVLFAPEVEQDLYRFIRILVGEDYFSAYNYAAMYVQDMVAYIQKYLPIVNAKPAPQFFSRYGVNLQYIIYKKSPRTTWYVLFEEHETLYHVTYITNNHIAGKYFNV